MDISLKNITKGSNSIQITRHLECGNLYPVSFSNFKYQNSRCSYCSSGRTEKLCREIFERVFNRKFPKQRPAFLEGLELDGYCEELRMAFEYNGIQHYEMNPIGIMILQKNSPNDKNMIYEKNEYVKKEELNYVSYHIQ